MTMRLRIVKWGLAGALSGVALGLFVAVALSMGQGDQQRLRTAMPARPKAVPTGPDMYAGSPQDGGPPEAGNGIGGEIITEQLVIEGIARLLVNSGKADQAVALIGKMKTQESRDYALNSLASSLVNPGIDGDDKPIDYEKAQEIAAMIQDPLVKADTLVQIAENQGGAMLFGGADTRGGGATRRAKAAATEQALERAIEAFKIYQSKPIDEASISPGAARGRYWLVGLGGLFGAIMGMFSLAALDAYGEAAGRAMVKQIDPRVTGKVLGSRDDGSSPTAAS
jgi:hypothetical protein